MSWLALIITSPSSFFSCLGCFSFSFSTNLSLRIFLHYLMAFFMAGCLHCTDSELMLKVGTICILITTCAILNNMSVDGVDERDVNKVPEAEVEGDDEALEDLRMQRNGFAVRDALIAEAF
ncbi:hypothetical protein CAPTEDRAFT_185681 [Capitella teleta]|uniref:Uncharacterized protein n=1 Tax=Capitella teleta TaxID=283909 RepID=R7U7Z7_CAPTE|nr:hypothetical protein CAPTEDRAFT_185681 [Capitella teleta]|eukprot:ELU02104.1 hypothetical protein CAPTEDRAFT_185681 [Capitella teleta]